MISILYRLDESITSNLVRVTNSKDFLSQELDSKKTIQVCLGLLKQIKQHFLVGLQVEGGADWELNPDFETYAEIEYKIFLAGEDVKYLSRMLYNTAKKVLPNLHSYKNTLLHKAVGTVSWLADNEDYGIPNILLELEFTEEMAYLRISLMK